MSADPPYVAVSINQGHLQNRRDTTINIEQTGKVVGVHVKDEFIRADGKLDVVAMKPLARMGYSDYTTVDHVFEIAPSEAAGVREDLSLGLEGAAGTMPGIW